MPCKDNEAALLPNPQPVQPAPQEVRQPEVWEVCLGPRNQRPIVRLLLAYMAGP